MKLRIIAGSLRGRFVRLADKEVSFRPTLERTRQSIVEIVKHRIVDSVAADICSGSGMFGFEMLSRGARRVDFVESSRRLALALDANARLLGVHGESRIIIEDVRNFVKSCPRDIYDIIFYDPPYDDPELQGLTVMLGPLLRAEGVLLHERRRSKIEAPDRRGPLRLIDTRTFGDTVVDFYQALPGTIDT